MDNDKKIRLAIGFFVILFVVGVMYLSYLYFTGLAP